MTTTMMTSDACVATNLQGTGTIPTRALIFFYSTRKAIFTLTRYSVTLFLMTLAD